MKNRRKFLKSAGAAAAFSATGGKLAWASDQSPVWKSSDKAAKFLKDIIAIDTLNANLELTLAVTKRAWCYCPLKT
ncbi:MAG: twin-arginine translocation signal domain-containing protein [Geminicoccaceae bacterium]